MLDRLLGPGNIEELAHDFFCVSADLVAAEPVIHRSGSLVMAVGASMSLPGLAPPLRDGARILVDGGVLDNLPIETMLRAESGPLIAVDVMGRGVPGAGRTNRNGEQLPTLLETVARARRRRKSAPRRGATRARNGGHRSRAERHRPARLRSTQRDRRRRPARWPRSRSPMPGRSCTPEGADGGRDPSGAPPSDPLGRARDQERTHLDWMVLLTCMLFCNVIWRY